MKRLNYLVNGLAALALIVLFSQCAGKADNQTTNVSAQAAGLSGMKIAYVEIDTLLAKYNYCVDLNEAMVKKSENVRLTLNQKAKDLDRNKLQAELMSENEKNSLQLRDSINAFLKEYNKTKGYSMIISNTGFDNLLYADSIYNITREILDGLNARYSSPKK